MHLPDELLMQIGWKEGDTLSIVEDDSGDLIIRRVEFSLKEFLQLRKNCQSFFLPVTIGLKTLKYCPINSCLSDLIPAKQQLPVVLRPCACYLT